MAVVKRLDKQTLTLKVPNGLDGHDNVKYKDMTFTGINKEISADAIMEAGKSLGTLMQNEPDMFVLTEINRLVNKED